MPDWRQLARGRLGALGLDLEREGEIVFELAQHLEDVYQDSRRRGGSAEEATAEALEEVPDWAELRRGIYAAERGGNVMNQRTKLFWLPGFFIMLLSMGLLWLFEAAGFRPRVIWLSTSFNFYLFLPWLAPLPLVGGLGAYYARRTGASRARALLVGVFPALAMAALFVLSFPVSLIVDSHVSMTHRLTAFAGFLLSAAIVPGVALLAGALVSLEAYKGQSGEAPRTA